VQPNLLGVRGVNDKEQRDYRGVADGSQRFFDVEPFVDADAVANFLSVKRKTILDWARAGIIPAHPYGRGKRVVWRFRISEIAGHSKQPRSTIKNGSPEVARLEQQYG